MLYKEWRQENPCA